MKLKNKKRKQSLTAMVSNIRLPSDYGWKALHSLCNDLHYLLTEDERYLLSHIISSRDYETYLSLSDYWGPQSHYLNGKTLAQMRAVYQAISLLKKYDFPESKIDKFQAAMDNFHSAEESCRKFNSEGIVALKRESDPACVDAITYAKSFLKRLLGDFPSEDGALTHWSRHGPGANIDTVNGQVSLYNKFTNWPYSCTVLAFPYARHLIQSDPRWLGALEDDYRRRHGIEKHRILDQRLFWQSVIKIVPGSRITTVPKDARKERTIAIEPAMNLMLQLGVDGYIRRRLKRWDIDIDDQTKNQRLAGIGSLNQRYSTLDLSAASDSISIEICKYLLPEDWFSYLMKLRSPEGDVNGETVSFEKISSMGNGYTFALETAIFASVIFGVQKAMYGCYDTKNCAVFGDDLIVTSDITVMVVELLQKFGFKLNLEKSFTEGPFRESCGADWFLGKPVRPVFFKRSPLTVPELYCDLNRMRRVYELYYSIYDEDAQNLRKKYLGWIPKKFHLFGPVSDEDFDSYIHCPTPSKFNKYRWCYRYRRLIAKPMVQRNCTNFLFRKLMHPLREKIDFSLFSWTKERFKGLPLTVSGSAFTVTRRGFVTVRQTTSSAYIWQSRYTA